MSFLILLRCGPLIDLCRGPHVRHTGKIKAVKIYKVNAKHTNEQTSLFGLQMISTKAGFLTCQNGDLFRTLQPTGRAALTWRLCRGSMGFLSQTQRC